MTGSSKVIQILSHSKFQWRHFGSTSLYSVLFICKCLSTLMTHTPVLTISFLTRIEFKALCLVHKHHRAHFWLHKVSCQYLPQNQSCSTSALSLCTFDKPWLSLSRPCQTCYQDPSSHQLFQQLSQFLHGATHRHPKGKQMDRPKFKVQINNTLYLH